MRRALLTTAVLSAAALILTLAPVTDASADVVTFDGELTASSPTFNRAWMDCSDAHTTANAVHYTKMTFKVDQGGLYAITMTAETLAESNGYFQLYESGFDQNSPQKRCLTVSRNESALIKPVINVSLIARMQYTLVITTINNGATGTFTNSISGPGTVTLGSEVPAARVSQAAGQADPTVSMPVDFNAYFTSSVTGLEATDFVVTGPPAPASSGSRASERITS